MAGNHSQDNGSAFYPFAVNPQCSKPAIAHFVTVRSDQMRVLSKLGEREDLETHEREALHGLVLELGLQQRMLKSGLL